MATVTPMAFGGEVDDIARIENMTCFEHEHASGLDFPMPASGFIALEVFWESFFELQGEAFAHHANAVDRIYRGFCVRIKKIAICKLDHIRLYRVNNTSRYKP